MLKISRTVTGPEPVTLLEAKDYNRVLFSVDDPTIHLLITQARQTLEQATNLSLVEQEIILESDRYRTGFRLPYGPVQKVTSCEVNGEAATVTDNGKVTTIGTGTLTAEYEAGGVEFQGLKIAICELVAFLYSNRGTDRDYPQTVKRWILNNTMNFFV